MMAKFSCCFFEDRRLGNRSPGASSQNSRFDNSRSKFTHLRAVQRSYAYIKAFFPTPIVGGMGRGNLRFPPSPIFWFWVKHPPSHFSAKWGETFFRRVIFGIFRGNGAISRGTLHSHHQKAHFFFARAFGARDGYYIHIWRGTRHEMDRSWAHAFGEFLLSTRFQHKKIRASHQSNICSLPSTRRAGSCHTF